jgi:hypothetical protein
MVSADSKTTFVLLRPSAEGGGEVMISDAAQGPGPRRFYCLQGKDLARQQPFTLGNKTNSAGARSCE